MSELCFKRDSKCKYTSANESRIKKRSEETISPQCTSLASPGSWYFEKQSILIHVFGTPSAGECAYHTFIKELKITLHFTWRSRMNCGNLWIGFIIRPYKVILSLLVSCRCWGCKNTCYLNNYPQLKNLY